MKRELTCICCPRGCALTVEYEGKEVFSVTGNTCPRGDKYAREEVVEPKRVVTSTVKVEGGRDNVTSVRTNAGVPKAKIFEVMKEINSIVLKAPVKIGDIAKKDICGTGADLLVTRNNQ